MTPKWSSIGEKTDQECLKRRRTLLKHHSLSNSRMLTQISLKDESDFEYRWSRLPFPSPRVTGLQETSIRRVCWVRRLPRDTDSLSGMRKANVSCTLKIKELGRKKKIWAQMIKNAWLTLSTKKSPGPLKANARTDKVIDKWGHPAGLETRTLPQAKVTSGLRSHPEGACAGLRWDRIMTASGWKHVKYTETREFTMLPKTLLSQRGW